MSERSTVARYKPDISLGNILTLVAMLSTVVVWGLRLEGRVDAQQQMSLLQQQTNELRFTYLDGKVNQQRLDIEKSLGSIDRTLQRIEHKLDGKADKR